MGGGRGKAKWNNWPRGAHGGQDGWEWRSSGSAWNPKGAGKWDQPQASRRYHGDQDDGSSQFPGFEEMKPRTRAPPVTRDVDGMEGEGDDLQVGSYMKGVQRILNSFRKAEGRTRKIESLKDELDAKWEAFQQSLKDSYMKERKKYQEKTARLTTDMEEVQQAKEDAIQELKDALKSPSSLTKNKAPVEDTDALEDLAKLLATPARGQRDNLSDLLAAALSSGDVKEAGGRTKLLEAIEKHKQQRTPTTPPRRRASYVDRTPEGEKPRRDKAENEDPDGREEQEASMDVELETRRDPYMTSPSSGGLNGILPSPGRGPSKTRMRAGRTPIKHVHRKPSVQPPVRACSKRLEQKRKEAMLEHVGDTDDEDDLIGELPRARAEPEQVEIE